MAIKVNYNDVIKKISNIPGYTVYQVGGSLLPHKTRDYDFLIYCSDSRNEIFSFWDRDCDFFDDIQYYDSYGSDYDTKKCTVKCRVEEKNYDLLYVHDKYLNIPISVYMDIAFPISAQRVAKNIATGEIIGEINTDYITYYSNTSAKYINKYKLYYPNAVFISIKGE